jgi:hypothetical protein
VQEVLRAGQAPNDAEPSNRQRAEANIHFRGGKPLPPSYQVFIGNERYSKWFPKAVNLQENDLAYRVIRRSNGESLSMTSFVKGKGNFISSNRSCRIIWDLDSPENRMRAHVAQRAIMDRTGYDLLEHLVSLY